MNIMWTKDDCSYCVKAKEILKNLGITYEERKLGHGWTKEDLLKDVPTATKVPQIFLWGKHVGGYTDLLQYIEDHGMNING